MHYFVQGILSDDLILISRQQNLGLSNAATMTQEPGFVSYFKIINILSQMICIVGPQRPRCLKTILETTGPDQRD